VWQCRERTIARVCLCVLVFPFLCVYRNECNAGFVCFLGHAAGCAKVVMLSLVVVGWFVACLGGTHALLFPSQRQWH